MLSYEPAPRNQGSWLSAEPPDLTSIAHFDCDEHRPAQIDEYSVSLCPLEHCAICNLRGTWFYSKGVSDMNSQASSINQSAKLNLHGSHAAQKSAEHLQPADKHQQAYQKALRLIREQRYQSAIEILSSAGQSPAILNLRGVCLLRIGSVQTALQVYRSYVLQTGGAWTRTDVPVSHVLNFATALLLSGHPAGCLEVLGSLAQQDHPMCDQLQHAIRTWGQSLPLWQRLNWRFGKIEPDDPKVPIDFVPGVVED